MNVNNIKRNYWSNIGTSYNNTWKLKTRKEMAKRELGFINYYLEKYEPEKILDIGVGTGRILDNLAKNTSNNTEIYGIDLAEEMVSFCRQKYKKNKKVKLIKTCDISKENINVGNKFDFITAIRVLKYNKNWQEVLKKIYKKLNKRGVLIFTMPNYNSINRFVKHKIPTYRTTVNELKNVLRNTGYEILAIKSFSKLPDILYDYLFPNSYLFAKTIIFLEKALELMLGKTLMGRILFIAVIKT